ncbi:MAG: hypothetical protein L0154_19980 [Chloroflexi bacterium]|nr:hypothetical protein [Chloroflexota bacterium]
MSDTTPEKNVAPDTASEAIVTVDWLDQDKQTVIVTYQRDGWTWSDYQNSLDKQFELIDSVEYPVDIVVMVNNTHLLPKGGSLITAIRRINAAHERQRNTVIVGASGPLTIFARNMLKIMPNQRKFFFADTLDEAKQLLLKHRE